MIKFIGRLYAIVSFKERANMVRVNFMTTWCMILTVTLLRPLCYIDQSVHINHFSKKLSRTAISKSSHTVCLRCMGRKNSLSECRFGSGECYTEKYQVESSPIFCTKSKSESECTSVSHDTCNLYLELSWWQPRATKGLSCLCLTVLLECIYIL